MSDTPVTITPSPAQQASQPPAWLPEKFWDAATGEVRVEALAKSYAELERALSTQALSALPHTANVPDSPEAYELELDDLLDIDDDVNQRLHAAGFSNDQAQLVYDLARERLVPLVEELNTQAGQVSEADDERQLERLVEHFGGTERFQGLRPQLRAWGEANLPRDVFETLAGSVEGVIALHTMMQSGEPGLGSGKPATGAAGEQDLKRMMADPRYWRERDPSYVAQVREGFKRLYPDQ